MVSVENNSILKKISAVIIMITALVFFSFNVFATTYNPTTYNTYQDSITYNGLTYSVRVTQLKAQSTGTSLLEAGQRTTMLVTLQLTNNNDSTVACTIPKLTIDCSDERVITGVDTYGGDLTLSLLTGGIGVFLPNEEFAYQNNKIIVPPNSSLYCVGAIYLPAKLNQDGSGVLDTGLRGAHLYDKSNYQVTTGSYSYGSPVDLSSVISAIDDLADIVATSADMQDIINLITYSGNSPVSLNSNGSIVTATNTHSQLNYRMTINRYVGKPYYIVNDFELDSSNDSSYQQSVVRYPFVIRVSCRNFTNKAIKVYWQLYTFNLFPDNNVTYSFNLTLFQSELFQNMTFSSSAGGVNFILRNTDNNNNGYIPNGTTETLITGYIDVASTTPLVWPTVVVNDSNMSVITPVTVDDYYPVNEYYILRDLYVAYSQVNGLDDSSDISNDVADVSDSNHIIEESYYSANASAIEATGLSNYRFSNEQNNGIGKVADDFMLLWNALGSWNGVYIFSLTMALATFIMRHGGLFTIKRETSDKGGDGD